MYRLLLSYERHVKGQADRPLPTPYLRPSKAVRRHRPRPGVSSYSVAKPPSAAASSHCKASDVSSKATVAHSNGMSPALSCRKFGLDGVYILAVMLCPRSGLGLELCVVLKFPLNALFFVVGV